VQDRAGDPVRFLLAVLIAAAEAVWLAPDVCLVACLWLRRRATARLRVQPDGIIAVEECEVWSAGTAR
jgi:hypothetical protein